MPLKARPYRKPPPFEPSQTQQDLRQLRRGLLPAAAVFAVLSIASVRMGPNVMAFGAGDPTQTPGGLVAGVIERIPHLTEPRDKPNDNPALKGYAMVGCRIPSRTKGVACKAPGPELPPSQTVEGTLVWAADIPLTPMAGARPNGARRGPLAATFGDDTSVIVRFNPDPLKPGPAKLAVLVTDADGMGLGESEEMLVDLKASAGGFATPVDSWRTNDTAQGVFDGELDLKPGRNRIEVQLQHRVNGNESVQSAVFIVSVP
ncbi:MAG TPA: hypothetical protein VEI97_07235 [bacterium]|nr:hypothetical protein [bacterium]